MAAAPSQASSSHYSGFTQAPPDVVPFLPKSHTVDVRGNGVVGENSADESVISSSNNTAGTRLLQRRYNITTEAQVIPNLPEGSS